MQSSPGNSYPSSFSEARVSPVSERFDNSKSRGHSPDHSTVMPTTFEGFYRGHMDMLAPIDAVAAYLNNHSDWFKRCAQPMAVEALGENGYSLTLGHFGALGYEVEPKIGLFLLPQEQGVYRIETIPVPGESHAGYDVDFRAALTLAEALHELSGEVGTQVQWDLNLTVAIQFPRFIQALPKSLVKATGDQLLNQIVRQISKRLTRRVQEDFHQTLGLPLPDSH